MKNVTYPVSKVSEFLKSKKYYHDSRSLNWFVERNDNTVFITADEMRILFGVEVWREVAANVVGRFDINVVK